MKDHSHEWQEGEREVRFCMDRDCGKTEIKSLADLRWHPYISGLSVEALAIAEEALEAIRVQSPPPGYDYGEIGKTAAEALAHIAEKKRR